MTSYLLHHAYRSARASSYSFLSLLILRILIEDLLLCKVMSESSLLLHARLCRQRPPLLPISLKPRPAICVILDILLDGMNHNLRRQLDIPLQGSIIGNLHRIISFLSLTRTKLTYHWSSLWQGLLAFVRFLTVYASDISSQVHTLTYLLQSLFSLLALSVLQGESFLPDAASYDDFFYKLVEAGEILSRFKTSYHRYLQLSPSTGQTSLGSSLDVLLQVAAHYRSLVETERQTGKLGNNPSPREVSRIIRQGYDSLSLSNLDGLDRWERYRESEERSFLKRMARLVVDDIKKNNDQDKSSRCGKIS